jgi:CheY-like chemotaxis protein
MSKPVVLLAAKSKVSRDLMAGHLKNSNLVLREADSGPAALEAARQHRPHLVFMEMELPEKSGVECCWQLRNTPASARTPIVLITRGSRPLDVETCRAAGCDLVLGKPLDRHAFLEAGRSLLASIDRRETRLPCRATVACRGSDGSFYGTIEDVSAHGMFIGTPQPLKVGEMLQLKFLLPWQEAGLIETAARVAWVNSANRRRKTLLPQGVGVVFARLAAAAGEQLASFLEHSRLRLNPPADW